MFTNDQLPVRYLLLFTSLMFVLVFSGCTGAGAPATVTNTALPPATNTPQPSDTVEPTDTSIPTETPLPPTDTPIPPTDTAEPTNTATISLTEMAFLNPAPRGWISMAYDVESDKVILFGGWTGRSRLPDSFDDDTWAYDVTTNTWTEMKPSSGPESRYCHEMVYDTESDRVILYGGAISDERLEDPIIRSKNDTWAYDYNTNTWTRMADGPEDSIGARMAYDAESDRAILFGGIAWMGDGWDLRSDTWAYDFNSDTWTEMKLIIKPPAWNFQGMAYDAKSDRVLMEMAPDIWSYDFNTNTWEKLENSEGQRPLSRDNPDMVYDAESDRMVLYGGEPGGNETWSYDYNTKTWTKMEPATVPGKVHGQAMVYNNTADRVILFGGKIGSVPYKYSGLTWSYDLNTDTWENVTPLP